MAKFSVFQPLLQRVEGGYQNSPNDSGNYNSKGVNVGTNHGISAKFFESVIKRVPTVGDIKAITLLNAIDMYKKYFWNAIKGDFIKNQSIANIIADHAVNAGVGTATKHVQAILQQQFGYPIKVDGVFGNETLKWTNAANQKILFDEIKQARIKHFDNIDNGKNSIFANGWINRLKIFVFEEKKKLPQQA